MRFSFNAVALWVALVFVTVMILSFIICGGWYAMTGLSLAFNLIQSWLLVGHGNMLLALGLQPNQPH